MRQRKKLPHEFRELTRIYREKNVSLPRAKNWAQLIRPGQTDL